MLTSLWLVVLMSGLLVACNCAHVNVTLSHKSDCREYSLKRGDTLFIAWDGNDIHCPLHTCTVILEAYDVYYHNNRLCINSYEYNLQSGDNTLSYEDAVHTGFKAQKHVGSKESRWCSSYKARFSLTHLNCSSTDYFRLNITAEEEHDTEHAEFAHQEVRATHYIVAAAFGFAMTVAFVLLTITVTVCVCKRSSRQYSNDAESLVAQTPVIGRRAGDTFSPNHHPPEEKQPLASPYQSPALTISEKGFLTRQISEGPAPVVANDYSHL